MKIDVDRYNETQARLHSACVALARGSGSIDVVLREYSRLCRGVTPSDAERAVIVLAKALDAERRKVVV